MDIFKDIFDSDDLQIDTNTTAEDIEEWDSLAHIRIITAIEEKFNIKFSVMEISNLTDVGSIVDAIVNK